MYRVCQAGRATTKAQRLSGEYGFGLLVLVFEWMLLSLEGVWFHIANVTLLELLASYLSRWG